uniref:Uncharacterized protein n=1 Tax=Physcomitrium patens TaxID=3218 RepID=A0A2K1IC47_PHYPA|nr:hypothetical protein PHYPA_030332 [Physcomitrium patens]
MISICLLKVEILIEALGVKIYIKVKVEVFH